ncbi:MAG: UDP-N-acetylmuramate dehydrogenase [Bacilli bacterium]|nr:UDP-N-acetylmuramate dehydrogenase [Bacilli bacterium]
MKEHIQEIKAMDIGKIVENVPLSLHTTYKVGGVAKCFVYPQDTKKLIKLLKYIKKNNIKYKILGNGSNTLFSDKEYDGIIIKLDRFDDIEIEGTTVTVGAGYNLIKLASLAAKKSLAGLEFASGIPGTLGGAVYMNAGAYKSDMGYIVKKVKVLTPDFKVINMTNRELNFHYRSSFFQKHSGYICLQVTLKLAKGKKEEIVKVNRERKQRRLESQPLEYPSAGSVFRNPEGLFAGKLIEDLGFKGLMKGGAQISSKHANFIINKNKATASDIKELIEFTKDAVEDKYNVKLKVEQEFVNWE